MGDAAPCHSRNRPLRIDAGVFRITEIILRRWRCRRTAWIPLMARRSAMGTVRFTRASGSRCRADSTFPTIVSQPTDESGLHLGTYFATAAGSANGNPPTEVVEAAPLTACGVEEIVVVGAASTRFPVVGSNISTVGGSFRRST